MRLILLILLSVCYADVIHVPADYSTIQEGIAAAAEDDIVVVSPATYQKNIVIDKTITLTSLALFNTETETIIDSLDTWFEWGTTQYDITNDSILTTIIDGSQPVNDSLGSTILIKAADDNCISPKILGFTITGGKGTLIDRAYVNPETGDTTYIPQYLGGGLFSYVTTPDIRYNYFYNNGSMDIEEGGAVYAVSDPDDCPFPTRSRCEIDEINFSHNFFRDNTSRLGKILGFTITGGKGTLIDRAIVNPETGELTGEHTPQHLGGGLFSYVTTPDIRYNYFYNNGSLDIEEGGAVYAVSDPDDCPFPTRSRCEIDEIDFSHNFFRDNTSRLGKILANRFFED